MYAQEVNLTDITTIGRDATCHISLQDPEKHVSRQHAVIELKGDNYFLTVISKTNPLTVNDQSYSCGKTVMLNEGDRIVIRQFILSVKQAVNSVPLAPWEDSFTSTGTKNSDPFGLDDLIAKPAPKQDFGPDPFAMLAPSPKQSSGLIDGVAPLGSDTAHGALKNELLDPMKVFDKKGGTPISSKSRNNSIIPQSSPFDELLGPQSTSSPGNRNVGANLSSSSPLVDFGGHRPLGTPSLNHVHDINAPYTPPPVKNSGAQQLPLPSAPTPAPRKPDLDDPFAGLGTYLGKSSAAPTVLQPTSNQPPISAAPFGDVFSQSKLAEKNRRQRERRKSSVKKDVVIQTDLDDPFAGLGSHFGKPPAAPAPLEPTAYQPPIGTDPFAEILPQSKVVEKNRRQKERRNSSAKTEEFVEKVIQKNQNQEVNSSDQIAFLINAFRNSAGLSKQPISAEEALAYMESAGTIVRTAIEGIVSLLSSRSMIKGEIGSADRTMVASRNNNPLKLMSSINEVMQFLFEQNKLNSNAYLPPTKSISGACEDLVHHEMGTAAGMRAAVEGSIRRFNPQVIETEFDKSSKKMVLNRKASLWEAYVEYYSKIESDMADDVGRIFERDFRKAYDEQIRKLKKKN